MKKGEPLDKISIEHIPAGPVLSHRYIYDYLTIKDDWNTQPLKLAPMPPFCAGRIWFINIDQKILGLQERMGWTYCAAVDAEHVSYSYSIEPWPRLIGFTSFAFSGADVGVPGNKRELELIAYAGANSYRPQHNFSDDLLPKGFYPADEKRTRVQIMADYANALGINYMNNIDQTLGLDRKVVQNDYDNFMARVYRHYDKLVPQLAPRPFLAAAYDLINEPFDHQAAKYNPAMKELTRRIRATDKTHLLFIEPCQAWGAIQQLELVEPTGDPLTIYSFHDYNFRLNKPDDRWPTPTSDIRNIYQMWMPAFMFQIKHGVPMHCGEFGGFSLACADSKSETILLNDFFRIFDQFGMSHHYYTGRELFVRNADGSLRTSNVVKAYRKYTSRTDMNVRPFGFAK